MSERWDAVVVGAGPNGLAAAVELARAGLAVKLFEAAETIGGGCRTEGLTLPGFRHDVCSAIHPMAAGSPAFSAWPLTDFGLEWVHPELPLAHPLDGGHAAALDRDLTTTAAGLGGDGAAWRDVFAPLAEHWQQLAGELLQPLLHLPRHPGLLTRFGLQALFPASPFAASRFAGEPARALFAGLAAHSILPLDRLATAAIGLTLGAAAHAVGWPFPRGGSQALADALAGYLASLGGEIETGRPVASLAELPPARAVLFDVSPGALGEIAGDELPAAYRRRLERFRHGPGVFKLDYALDGPVPWAADACRRAGTVHLGGTLEEIAAGEAAVWRGELPERPYVLVAQHGPFDPSRAPEGRQTLWAYCHVPPGCDLDMSDAVEEQLERFAPGFRDRVLARHALGPEGFERRNPNYVGGDITGGVADLPQLLARPTLLAPYRTPKRGLYLCSASTPPGGGVHGMCGVNAARLALEDLF